MGLSYAIVRRVKRGQPIDGEFLRRKHLWPTSKSTPCNSKTSTAVGDRIPDRPRHQCRSGLELRSTGRILEWLTTSLPNKRLEETRHNQTVEYVANFLGSQRYQAGTSSLSTRKIVAVGHALHALALYDERVFKPFGSRQEAGYREAGCGNPVHRRSPRRSSPVKRHRPPFIAADTAVVL